MGEDEKRLIRMWEMDTYWSCEYKYMQLFYF